MDNHASHAPGAYRSTRRPTHAARRALVVPRRLDSCRHGAETRASRDGALRSRFAQGPLLCLVESLLLRAAYSLGAGAAGAGRLARSDVERFPAGDPGAASYVAGQLSGASVGQKTFRYRRGLA